MSVPDDLEATVSHIQRLDEQIARLSDVRDEAMEQLLIAAARTELDYPAAKAFYDWLLDHEIRGRGDVMKATGWSIAALNAYAEDGDCWPGRPCVYLLIDGWTNEVVYVGRTSNLRKRLRSHRRSKRGAWDRHEAFPCDSKDDAADLEAVLIQQHRPRLNRRVERRR